MKNYSIIFVLSAVRLDSEGNFPNYERNPHNADEIIYTGGGVRMEAMRQFAELYSENKIITVGGLERNKDGEFSKAKEMADWLRRKNPNVNISFLNSQTSTRGNLSAIAEYLLEQNLTSPFAILTNKYHQERVSAFWETIKQNFPNLPALKFVFPEDLGLCEVVSESDESYRKRLTLEREGVAKIREGTYNNFGEKMK